MRYDRATYVVRCSYVLIKTTRPRRARLPEDIPASSKLKFQSTRPRRARLTMCTLLTPRHCFNPRAHEGRDPIRSPYGVGVSGFNPRAHEGRDLVLRSAGIVYLFQPTRPRRARRIRVDGRDATVVSTHAPTKGATKKPLSTWHCGSFNPRAHEGRDMAFNFIRIRIDVSTHAPTKGATTHQKTCCVDTCFNPRAHEGRDVFCLQS